MALKSIPENEGSASMALGERAFTDYCRPLFEKHYHLYCAIKNEILRDTIVFALRDSFVGMFQNGSGNVTA